MNTENKNSYYDILEVSEHATQHDIIIAYEKIKRTYSSENSALYNVFNEAEVKLFRQIIDEAFSILGNQAYRSIYEKRRNSKHYSESELTVEAIKSASRELFPEFPKKTVSKEPAFIFDKDYELEIAKKIEWNGEDLKKVREYKKISIEELHEKTKINPWYLTAIEKMDAQNLPAAVFVRGYVIQIARVLNLKDLLIADSYMKIFRKKIEN